MEDAIGIVLEFSKANDDASIERGNFLVGYQTGDFYCHYLLFVPTDLDDGGAKHIGMYRERRNQEIAGANNAATRNGPSEDWDLDTMVE